jgi:hypothetical protein
VWPTEPFYSATATAKAHSHQYDTPQQGSLSWCLTNYSGGPFPEFDSLAERERWLDGFITFCCQQGIGFWSQTNHATKHWTSFDLDVDECKQIVTDAQQRYLEPSRRAHQAERAAEIARNTVGPGCPAAHPWTSPPLPQPLNGGLLPVVPFDESLFPVPLRPALADLAHRMQSPPDWVATAMIVGLGAMVGARCGIHPKQYDTSWVEVPNLWGAVVAEPSKMKTPTIAAAIAPLRKLEKAAQAAFDQANAVHEAAMEELKTRKEAVKIRIKTATKNGNLSEVGELTQELAALAGGLPPELRRYIVNDSTVEKITELLGLRSKGLLVLRDELTGLLQSWDKPGHENDRAFYLEAWTGTGSYTSDRIGRGTTRVAHCCLSVFGGIQPDKIEPYLAQTLRGQNDGMMQRFQLLTWPDPRPYTYVDVSPNAEAHAQLTALFHRLDALDFTTIGATLVEGEAIPCFRFGAEAQAFFVDWLTSMEGRLRQDDESAAVVEHLAKYRKLFPALSLVFHLVDIASEDAHGPVSLRAAQLAARWCTYLESHARRLYAYRSGAARSTQLLATKLSRKAVDSPTFKARDVVRHGWQSLTETKVVEAALEELVATGWIREVPPPPGKKAGRPAAPSYQINPRIYANT